MSVIVEKLRRMVDQEALAFPGGWCVAFSGGSDSTALVWALASLRSSVPGLRMRAVHVNHNLHPDSHHWASHCQTSCATLGIHCTLLSIEVTQASAGLEAAARDARYRALAADRRPGEALLTAHHREDQLETVLIRLFRGSGVLGLSGISYRQNLGEVPVLRPWLEVAHADIIAYVQAQDLQWIDDPSNRNLGFDRNYLRQEIIPRVRQRWPGVSKSVARAARLTREAACLEEDAARADAQILVQGRQVSVSALRRLPAARQRNVLRHLCRQWLGCAPPEARLREGLEQLLFCATDRHPLLAWPQGQIRRYQDRLYFLHADPAAKDAACAYQWQPHAELDLGPIRGRLRLIEVADTGLCATIVEQGLQVNFRRGGERIRPAGEPYHRSLKQLFQRRAIVPWMRPNIPLIWAGEHLVAVGDLWFAAENTPSFGLARYRVQWDEHEDLL